MEKGTNKNEAQNNDLKIELYPEKKPRYKYNRSSLKRCVTKDTLAFSFNEEDELAYINSKTPVLNGFYVAILIIILFELSQIIYGY